MKIDEPIFEQMMTDHAQKLYQYLPNALQELADLIGVKAALKLSSAFGGLDYEIPKGQNSQGFARLMAVVGVEASGQLLAAYGGDTLYIPKCHALKRMLRNQAFFTALSAKMEDGTSQHKAIKELAVLFDMSERLAYGLLRQRKISGLQGGKKALNATNTKTILTQAYKELT